MLILPAQFHHLPLLNSKTFIFNALTDNPRQVLVLPIPVVDLLVQGCQSVRICQFFSELHHDDRTHSLVEVLLQVVDFFLEGNHLLQNRPIFWAFQEMDPELKHQIGRLILCGVVFQQILTQPSHKHSGYSFAFLAAHSQLPQRRVLVDTSRYCYQHADVVGVLFSHLSKKRQIESLGACIFIFEAFAQDKDSSDAVDGLG